MQEYLTIKQVAERLNISVDTAYDYSHMKGFPSIKIGKLIRIPADELEKWLQRRKVVA